MMSGRVRKCPNAKNDSPCNTHAGRRVRLLSATGGRTFLAERNAGEGRAKHEKSQNKAKTAQLHNASLIGAARIELDATARLEVAAQRSSSVWRVCPACRD